MATNTTNLSLTKPDYTDAADIAVINRNMDAIDTKMGAVGNTNLQAQVDALNGKLNTIGSMFGGVNNSQTVSVQTTTVTEINSITLTEAGRYLLIGCADWVSNANGYRQISFGEGVNPGRNFTSTTVGISGKETYQQVVYLAVASAGAEYRLYGIQTSGSTLSVYPSITAIRIQ